MLIEQEKTRFLPQEAVDQFEIEDELERLHGDGHFALTYRESQENGYQGKVYFTNPFDENSALIEVPTYASREDVESVRERIYPLKEAYEQLHTIATAYSLRQILLIEGPTSIGKTYLVDRFTEMIHGQGERPIDFYCNGQTEVDNLMAKFTPRTLQSVREGDESELQKTGWEVKEGALPIAMGKLASGKSAKIAFEDYPEGGILHIQEVGMASPNVINALLEVRGTKGDIAQRINLWESGQVVEKGKDTWIVMTTNPVAGYLDRNEIDPALARGLLYKSMAEGLSPESILTSIHYSMRDAAKDFVNDGRGINLAENEELRDIIANAISQIHSLYGKFIAEGEMDRIQRLPETLTDIHRVTNYIQHNQRFSRETNLPDITSTLQNALRLYYVDRVASPKTREALEAAIETVLRVNPYGDELVIPGEGESNSSDTTVESKDLGVVTFKHKADEITAELYGTDDQKMEKLLNDFDIISEGIDTVMRSNKYDISDELLEQLHQLQRDRRAVASEITLNQCEELYAAARAIVEEMGVGQLEFEKVRIIDWLSQGSHESFVYNVPHTYNAVSASGDEVTIFNNMKYSTKVSIPHGVVKDLDVIGSFILISADDNRIEVLDMENGKHVDTYTFFGEKKNIQEIHVDHQKNRLYILDSGGGVTIVSSSEDSVFYEIDSELVEDANIAVSQDGKYLAVQNLNADRNYTKIPTIDFIDLESFKLLNMHRFKLGSEISEIIAVGASHFASVVNDNLIILHDIENSNIKEFSMGETVRAMSATEDGRTLIVATAHKIYKIDLTSDEPDKNVATLQIFSEDQDYINDIQIINTPLGHEILVASTNGVARLA